MNIGRYEHHLLASLIASREIGDVEASAITGYSPHTISNLRCQRQFQALVAHYASRENPPPPPDMDGRIQNLGLSALEVLKERLEEDPGAFSRHELLAMAELLLVKARSLAGNSPRAAAEPVKLSVTFVASQALPEPEPINILDGVSYSRGNDAQ